MLKAPWASLKPTFIVRAQLTEWGNIHHFAGWIPDFMDKTSCFFLDSRVDRSAFLKKNTRAFTRAFTSSSLDIPSRSAGWPLPPRHSLRWEGHLRLSIAWQGMDRARPLEPGVLAAAGAGLVWEPGKDQKTRDVWCIDQGESVKTRRSNLSFFGVRNWFVSNSNQLQLCVLFLSNDLAWTPFYSLCYAKAAATVAWCSLSSDHLQKWDGEVPGEVSKKYSPDFYWLLLFLGLCSVLAEWNRSRGPCATMWEDVRNYWTKATWAYTHLQGVLRKTCATTICNGFPLDRCMQSVGICIVWLFVAVGYGHELVSIH